jgi:hypothetical protein
LRAIRSGRVLRPRWEQTGRKGVGLAASGMGVFVLMADTTA